MSLRIIIFTLLFILFNRLTAQGDLRKADSLENCLKTQNLHDSVKLKVYYGLAYEYLYSNDAKTLEYADKTIELADKLKKSHFKGEALSLQGVVYKNKGEYPAAIKKHLEGRKYKEENKDTVGLAICHNDLGILYKSMKNFPEALINYRFAYKYSVMGKMHKGICMTLNNIGTIHSALDQDDSALFYYNQALTAAEKISYKSGLATTYSNLGEAYGKRGEPEKALGYFEKALQIDIEKNDQYGMILSYINVGNAYKEMKRYDDALVNFTKAENLCTDNDAKPLLKDLYSSMAESYRAQNNYTKAFEFLSKYTVLKDSILNKEVTSQIAEMQTKFDTERKDLEIAKQTAEIQSTKLEVQRKNIISWTLAGAIILILLLSYLFYNRYKLKQRAILDAELLKQQELRSKAIIEAEEKERMRIARDLHDGIGQSLSAAKLNLSSLENKLKLEEIESQSALRNAIDLVDESVKEVRAVSHSMMPNALLKQGLVAAVREFINRLSAIDNLKIDLEITGLSERLEASTETVLFRVLQEIVSNIVKHANANHITIQIMKYESELTIMIEDNGVGFDTSKMHEFNGIGLKNITSRIEFLNGTVNFDSNPGKGTTVIIEIPA
ncbi:MAG TPA: sensor histidine kinase [Bacteroidia bacterium]|jgi:signal transduction histidine kinase